ncbi:MAG TPA: hypothetical protein VL574_05580 [Stellaceae bacterium]|nr:hypothetical protein [Stellaceae bacterium]
MEAIYKYSRRIDSKYCILFGVLAFIFMLVHNKPISLVPLGIFFVWAGINYGSEYKPFSATISIGGGIIAILSYFIIRSL